MGLTRPQLRSILDGAHAMLKYRESSRPNLETQTRNRFVPRKTKSGESPKSNDVGGNLDSILAMPGMAISKNARERILQMRNKKKEE